jgi:hypothetical protein
MIRWFVRYQKLVLVLGAISSLLVASGAGARWGMW